MTRKWQNQRSQTNPWHCHDTQKTHTHTASRTTQPKQNNQRPIPHLDDCKTRRTPRTPSQYKTQQVQQQTIKRRFLWKITNLYGSLAILVLILLKITKLPSQQSMLGHYRPASKTPFKWRLAGGPIKAFFEWYYLDPLSLKKKKKKKKRKKEKKTLSGFSWTTPDKTFWIRT